MPMNRHDTTTPNMALFCDFENVALGVREARFDRFDISRVLERLLLKGSIVVKKAYCDWERYRDHKAAMHEASFELIEIPHVRMSGKNSADIRMVVDALDLCYTKAHVDCFVIISGDSDFSPLVSKLRENAKTVIGVGVKNSTSDLLIKNCDEFIFYDDLVRAPGRRAVAKPRPATAPASSASSSASSSIPAPAPGQVSTVSDPAAAPAGSEAGNGGGSGSRQVATSKTTGPRSVSDGPASATKAADRGTADRGTVGKAVDGKVTAEKGRAEKATTERGAAEGGGKKPAPAVAPKPVASRPVAVATEVEAPVSEERILRGLDLIVETVDALVAERDEDERVWSSMVKQALKRRNPGFNEQYYGYRSFNRMLEDARDRHLIVLEGDARSGSYIVRVP